MRTLAERLCDVGIIAAGVMLGMLAAWEIDAWRWTGADDGTAPPMEPAGDYYLPEVTPHPTLPETLG